MQYHFFSPSANNLFFILQFSFCFFVFNFKRKLEEKIDELVPVFVKGRIEEILHTIFGEIGGQTTIDILKLDPINLRLLIRVPEKYYVKVRAALTLIPTYQGIPCYFKVLQASPILLGLIDSVWEIC